jgi:hypothetical protein
MSPAARPLDLDHVGTHECEELRAGWPRLHVGKSRMRTPSSPCPQGFADGGGRPLAAADLAARLFCRFLRARFGF